MGSVRPGTTAGNHQGLDLKVLTRRRFLRALASAGAVLPLAAALAACGGEDEPASTTSPTSAATASPGTTQEAAATPTTAGTTATAEATGTSGVFPVTVEHKFGTTEIPEEPERVVTIGFSEQDPVLALGVKPVAVREWFGNHPYAVWPWALDELGDAEPQVLVMPYGELDFETIAALRSRRDHRDALRYHGRGVRDAVADRPHGGAVGRLPRLRHAVAGADPADRPRARA